MSDQTKAYLYAGATVLMWSTVAAAFKIALRDLSFTQVLFVAAPVSASVLLLVVVFQGKGAEIIHVRASSLKRSALLGLVNPLFYYLILFKAYDLLPAQEAQPLNWTWPITLALLSALFLGQRLRIRTLLAVLVSFSGVLVISTRGDIIALRFSNPIGVLLAVGSSVLWAVYWIMNLKDQREQAVKLFWNFAFGSVYAAVFLAVFDKLPSPASVGFMAAVYIGLFEMGLAFVLWLRALTLSRDSAAIGIFAYLTPFISLIFIHFVLGERIMLSSVAGLALIIGGIGIKRFGRT